MASWGQKGEASPYLTELLRLEENAKNQGGSSEAAIRNVPPSGVDAMGPAVESKQKEVFKVVVTEVMGGGKFYAQMVGDKTVASIQQQLASLNLQEPPVIGTFNPKKGDFVLAQFSADNSWKRAIIVDAPPGAVECMKDEFHVFYIDYGSQEQARCSALRPMEASVASSPHLAHMFRLAYVKVPSLEEDYGAEAAEFLSAQLTSGKEFWAKVEDRDLSGGKSKEVLIVNLVAVDAEISVNAAMVQEGLARIEKRNRWDSKDRKLAFDNLEKFEHEARTAKRGIFVYGDLESDDEDDAPSGRKTGGRP